MSNARNLAKLKPSSTGLIGVEDLESSLDLTGKTVTLPAGVGGKVLQVVSATKTNTFSTTGTAFVDVSGLSVSITPTSASSKILIISSVNGQGAVSQSFLATRLMRNSTEIAIGDANSSAARATSSTGYTGDSGGQLNLSMTHLDSPATTSAVTYKVQASSLASTAAFINRSQGNDGSYSRCMTASAITVMEIAG
jgi:hypothetical protein